MTFSVALFNSNAQEANTLTAGVGIGLDYGGLGGQLGYQIDNQWGAFVGLGATFVASGYNLGVKYLLDSKSNQFFLEAMYGYNAIILADNPSGENTREIYYDPSFGGGMDAPNKGGNSFWHFTHVVRFNASRLAS